MVPSELTEGRRVNGVVGAVHVHSDYSHDGRDPLERVRDRAAVLGIRFLALTDHAEDFDAARFQAYSAACRTTSTDAVQLIPGLEFRFPHFRGLHLLACGLREWITPATPDEFMAMAPTVSGLTIVAHPVLARYRIPLSVWNGIDAVEVWNATYNTRYLPDPQAIELLRTLRCTRASAVAVAGLDQHDAANDRGTRVVLLQEADAANPLAALRAGRFINRGRTMSFTPQMDWPRARLAALKAARVVFDGIERTQEHLTRAWRRRQARRRLSGQQ
jgi:hypothetical protein